MKARLFGMETEYAFTARATDGLVLEPAGLVQQMERLAGRLQPSVPGFTSAGVFLANGSRLYRDPAGGYTHLEIAGPECANPWDVVRYLQAGERLLVSLAAALREANRLVDQATFYKSNVDYYAHTAWGCHESYLTSQPLAAVSPQIVPHLVSRLILTGAGGFDGRAPGIEFLLSPRVAHTSTVEGQGSQLERPIFHTKDEPLSRAHQRLHVICGESTCAEESAWIKVAATALVVALIDAGLRPGDAVTLADPVAAMRAFARDPDARATADLADGRRLNAVAVQRHYLDLAERHQADAFMPAWAPRACAAWRRLLDRVERGPAHVRRSLDWAIKFAWFQQHAARRGFDWNRLPDWNAALVRLQAAAREPIASTPDGFIPDTRVPLTPATRAVLATAPGPGLDWEQLPRLLRLRRELFELDWRYAELGPGSLFEQLDRAGLLQHRVAGVDNIEHAMDHPPDFGRARVRGRAIRRVAHVRTRFACDWGSLWDLENRAMLDLGDPFAEEEQWQNVSHLPLSRLFRPPPAVPAPEAGATSS